MRYIPLRFQPTASAAGTKPQKRGKSLLSKTPLRDCVLDDTVKKKATEELPKPLCCHNTLPTATPSSHLISLLPFQQPSPHFFLSHPAIPLINTLWLPLPLLLRRPGWMNIAHFSLGGKWDTWTPTVVHKPQESVSEDFRREPIKLLPFSIKAQEQMSDGKRTGKEDA